MSNKNVLYQIRSIAKGWKGEWVTYPNKGDRDAEAYARDAEGYSYETRDIPAEEANA